MTTAEQELRQMAREAIDTHPYIRYRCGEFPDPEMACTIMSMHGIMREANDPTSLLSRLTVVCQDIREMPGGIEALARFDETSEKLTEDAFPICRSRADMRRVVKIADSYMRRRLSALIQLKLDLGKAEK